MSSVHPPGCVISQPTDRPIDNLVRPVEMTADSQRGQLDLLKQLNEIHREGNPRESEWSARIESFELAYRMQTAGPDAIDIASESAHIQRLYGIGDERCDHFARQCLTARRLVERGVRFVQIYSRGMENQLSWDGYIDIQGNHSQFAAETDQPVAGPLSDLDQRVLSASVQNLFSFSAFRAVLDLPRTICPLWGKTAIDP
jgi:hypothetical protein